MKRQTDGESYWEREAKLAKTHEEEFEQVVDLIVLGLEWSVTDDELLTYFEQYGKVTFAEVTIL